MARSVCKSMLLCLMGDGHSNALRGIVEQHAPEPEQALTRALYVFDLHSIKQSCMDRNLHPCSLAVELAQLR